MKTLDEALENYKMSLTLEDYRKIRVIRHRGLADAHARRASGFERKLPELEEELAKDFEDMKTRDRSLLLEATLEGLMAATSQARAPEFIDKNKLALTLTETQRHLLRYMETIRHIV
jgi:hypothetical protein